MKLADGIGNVLGENEIEQSLRELILVQDHVEREHNAHDVLPLKYEYDQSVFGAFAQK